MRELYSLHIGVPGFVDRAYNHLRRGVDLLALVQELKGGRLLRGWVGT